MPERMKRVPVLSPFIWIGVVTLVFFNLAAAISQSERLAFAALALTGLFASAALVFGFWANRTLAKARR